MNEQAPILEAREVTKRFPGVLALDRVSFQLLPGEVHALVGENGAGKSTLIKVITGVYAPDEGRVLFGGEEVSFASPRDSQAAGISTIYQEINLIPMRSVAQNVFLGRELRTRFGLLDSERMNREAAEILGRYGIQADVTAPLHSLGLGTQQMVAVARAVSLDARVVIMDEPTSSLEAREVETLFRVIRQLRDENVGVVYVSHQLDELYEICEKVTVLRDGKLVHSGDLAELSKLQLIATMLGRELAEVERRATGFGENREVGREPVLQVRGLTRRYVLDGVSFDVRPGEIVGLAGLLGAGRSETAKAIFGAQPLDSGEVQMAGKDVKTGSPPSAIKAGIAFLPEDRRSEGIIPGLSVRENIVAAAMPRLSRVGLVSEKAQNELVERFMERLGIKASSPDQPVGELSGGNQQKVMLARWLCLDPKVLILDEPTRGIDVGAKAEVQHLIDELAEGGLGVIMISSELEEVVEGSDRVVVLRNGSVAGTLSGDDISEENLMETLAEGGSSENGESAGE
ncbi:MAG TPA: sugar ABC transporter ATP-binding protein [Solirubrobacterales bacterium]|nr:sugar ABC transporter ATP-binding protein [Solirubrobacterales bacterium]